MQNVDSIISLIHLSVCIYKASTLLRHCYIDVAPALMDISEKGAEHYWVMPEAAGQGSSHYYVTRGSKEGAPWDLRPVGKGWGLESHLSPLLCLCPRYWMYRATDMMPLWREMVNSLGERRLNTVNKVIHSNDLMTPGTLRGAQKWKPHPTSTAGITTLKSIRRKKSKPKNVWDKKFVTEEHKEHLPWMCLQMHKQQSQEHSQRSISVHLPMLISEEAAW